MNKQTHNLDTFKSKLSSTQVLSSKELQDLKGGAAEPPPFGIESVRYSEPPPFGIES